MSRKLLAGIAIAVMTLFVANAKAAADWETDFDKAATNALTSQRYMLLDFSGSDWCGWCIKLDKEVFSKADFKKYAKENLICVLVDFPQQKPQKKRLKAQNEALAKKYEVKGYPTVIILSPDGDLVGRTGYQEGGPTKYVESIKDMIAAYEKQHPKKEAEKKAAPGKAKAEASH
jgi:protein disulfide-isomerase